MTTTNNAPDTIVAFHIGRGGRFNNQGHLSYCGEKRIGDFLNRYELHLAYENHREVAAAIEGDPELEAALEAIDPYNTPEQNAPHIALLADHGHDLGEIIYVKDTSGGEVGLTLTEEDSGIGRIDNDGEYDTTYTCKLGDCDDRELQAIINSNLFSWLSADDQSYVKTMLDVADEVDADDNE